MKTHGHCPGGQGRGKKNAQYSAEAIYDIKRKTLALLQPFLLSEKQRNR